MKYAVLHLQAGVEALLKARLQREHWSLVAAVERLRKIADVNITNAEVQALKDLARDRNALQHYGLQHNVRAVEARAAPVLDFLMRFLDVELLPQLSPEELQTIEGDVSMARRQLSHIKSFVRHRMNRPRGNEPAGLEHRTAYCTECRQDALVVNAGGGRCHFCSTVQTVEQLIADVWRDPDPQGSPGMDCPFCCAHTLIGGAAFIDPSNDDAFYCLSCTREFKSLDLGTCVGCGCPWFKDDEHLKTSGQLLCADCQRRIRLEDDEKYWQ
ncbi:hypothetical protein G3I40_33080 [Streptomyces sp. SID14478]|uniref:hypothetical protein n=1 Tax=Streptomyces sp. SID14478 TaxID=2706073 RepID=UPI0013DC3A95|nr:hypothetical protein [Streptomyces sp. SID14478]NEB80015.1 hypothetical protein [Streptomyces sp. SID14478]